MNMERRSPESFKFEECPLHNHTNCQKRPRNLKGPLRVLRLCILGILLPSLLIAVPLYLRYHVYGHQLYPLAMSDMRLLDNRISTTWCQRQSVKVNATFNAFLLAEPPSISPNLRPLSMVRHLVLEDDTKEYWGFYLLKGSSVTVSTCVRWPGASLIVIRGHKHLHECAYIGDNSSEELDELMEAIREGTYKDPNADIKRPPTVPDDGAPANEPALMKRHRAEVEFHDPIHKNTTTKNHTIERMIDTSDITDPKILKAILQSLQEKTRTGKRIKNNGTSSSSYRMPDFMHLPRNKTVAQDERRNIKIVPPTPYESPSKEAVDEIFRKLQSLGTKSENVLKEVNRRFEAQTILPRNPEDGPKMIETNGKTAPQGEQPQQREESMNMRGRQYAKPPVDFDDNVDKARRRRRDIEISPAMDHGELATDDAENDMAIEEDFVPDGIADHRGTFNETTLNDYSNSEFWSSFSSSEEALLNCAGLILNLPLTPHHKCSPTLTEEQAEETYLANTITYKVPINGYYFFVFNSENEVQPNYLRVQFHLKKAVYNLSDTVATCTNSSDACSVDLSFLSSQKLVMELPINENNSLGNEEFVVISECEPRTVLYAICVISVPVLVILFAFS